MVSSLMGCGGLTTPVTGVTVVTESVNLLNILNILNFIAVTLARNTMGSECYSRISCYIRIRKSPEFRMLSAKDQTI